MRTDFISVIVPVRNEEGFIARTLDALVDQDFPVTRLEVLVVDGQSTDRTREIVREYAGRYPHISLHENPKRWSSAARNIGVARSRGDVLVVVDGHCELRDRDYLSKLAAAFERSDADCVGRPQPLDVTGATPLQRAIAAARSSPLGHHPDSFIYAAEERFVPAHSVAVAYRRSVFDRVGRFDERFDACEDVELNHRVDRAGLKCFFTPDVAVRYVPRATLRGLFRQLVRYGRGRIRLLRKHADTFSLKTLIPMFFVIGLIVGPIAAWFVPALAVAFAAVMAFYAVLVLLTSVAIGLRSGGFGVALRMPWTIFVIHISSGVGQLLELVCGRRMSAGDNEPPPLVVAEPHRPGACRQGGVIDESVV